MKESYLQIITRQPRQPGDCPKSLGARLIALKAILAVLVALALPAQAQVNLLSNPGAEQDSFASWTTWNNVGYNFNVYGAGTAPPHSGNYSFQIFGDYNSGGNTYCGMFQTFPAHPGQVFNADGWVYQLPSDYFSTAGDANNAYLEVTFIDSNNQNIAKYDSIKVTNGSPTGVWYDLQVTNQYDPASGNFLGGVSQLVAPANSVSVEYDIVFDLVAGATGSTYWDDQELLSTVIPCYLTNVVPAGVILATNQNLTFTAVGPGGPVTNVTVTVTAVSGLANAVTTTVSYTNSSPGSISGVGTGLVNYSLPLAANQLYTVVISATDVNLNKAVKTAYFDTLQPVYVVEAEDFNYGGGQWDMTITPDGGLWAYANDVGQETIDEHDGDPGNGIHHYRPSDPVSVQGAAEEAPDYSPMNRQKYLNDYALNPSDATNPDTQDEEVGYVNNGDWQDYTRNFPAGNYNVYARLAVDGKSQITFAQVLSDPTMSPQTTTNLGTFSITSGNWNQYQYCPLLDQYGNLVSVPLGGAQTVRLQVAPGDGPNANFFMLVPAATIPTPVYQGSYPDGLHPFEPTNSFSFTVGQGAGSAIPAGNIGVTLNGANVTAQVHFSSTATNWTGTIPIASNSIETAVISVTNGTHLTSTFTIAFDTFSESNYMFEAEDWDFNSGMFIDNPQPSGDDVLSGGFAEGTPESNSYYGYPEGQPSDYTSANGVDWGGTESGQSAEYRLDTPGTQTCSDYLRQKFVAAQAALGDPNIGDFNLGWFSAGVWFNYTRHYPVGNYYVYGRMAGGAGPFSGTLLSEVTSGAGTTTQTTNVLGSFADPNAAGWQSWHWVPMLNAQSNMAIVNFDGTQQTLTLTSGNNVNVNFLMLAPAPLTPMPLTATRTGSQVNISFATQTGHAYTVLYTSSLSSPTAWSILTTINGNGSIQTATDTISGTARFYRVSAQ